MVNGRNGVSDVQEEKGRYELNASSKRERAFARFIHTKQLLTSIHLLDEANISAHIPPHDSRIDFTPDSPQEKGANELLIVLFLQRMRNGRMRGGEDDHQKKMRTATIIKFFCSRI